MDLNAKNIVDSLIQGAGSEARKDIEVKDESMFSRMMKGNGTDPDEEETIRWEGVCRDIRWDRPLPVSRAVFHFLWSCFMGLVFAVYSIFEWLALKLTGRHRNFRQSVRTNAVILYAGLITTVSMIVVMVVFFIKDILLFPADNNINSHGTVTMAQPCGVEHNVLLVNSAEFWAETGIRVVKGDKVRIAASGAFYGQLVDMHDAALDNKVRRFPPDNFHWKKELKTVGTGKEKSVTQFCVYGRNGTTDLNARFGSLIYQIKPEGKKPVSSNSGLPHKEIFQIEPKKDGPYEFRAAHSGVLCFAVNDIFLDDEAVLKAVITQDSLAYVSNPDSKDLLLETKTIERLVKDTTGEEHDMFVRNIISQNRSMWYDDNIGEILLNVNIERKHPGNLLSFLTKPFRWIFHHNGWLHILITCSILMLLDLITGILMRRRLAGKQN